VKGIAKHSLSSGSISPFTPSSPFVVRVKSSLAVATRYLLLETETNGMGGLNGQLRVGDELATAI
jgi:hypothetical protein